MAPVAWYQLAAAVLILFLNGVAEKAFAQSSCDGKVKIDCLPGNGSPTEKDCQSKGCCWQETADLKCAYPKGYVGYTVTALHTHSRGVDAELERRGPPSGFPKDVQKISLTVEFLNSDLLRIRITDPAEKRWETPLPKLNLPSHGGNPSYTVKVLPEQASFQIIRKSTLETIFDTSVGGFIFSDQFIQLSTLLPTNNIYGIGEHHDDLNRGQKAKTYTLFNRGDLVPTERSGFNLYGSHPLYLGLEKSGSIHGVFLYNSNAMDIEVQPENPSLTYRVTGGVLDFFFFMGPTGDEIVRDYILLVGRPFIVPYWSLGFHLSRYGFNTTEEIKKTWIENKEAGIPVDTMWSDIDYMDHMKDFTLEPEHMAKLKEFVEELHGNGVKYIMNNSPGLTGTESPGKYPPLDEAKKLDLFIKDYKGDLLEAVVWQNVTYMLDFSNPQIMDYWEKYFRQFHEKAPFDGAWIDMNEPYSFHLGSLNGCPAGNPLDYPPYVPGKQVLYNGTICLSAQQHLSTHYNLHNLYAMMETIAMHRALANMKNNSRTFVLSRASSPGFGAYGAHWSGDVHSNWEHLRYSIINMINFNIYGVPMIGTDICGFVGSVSEELCIRWMQLGAFYPFSRNHNDFDTNPQDPASWKNATTQIMKEVVETRYKLLPFFYSLMMHSHVVGQPAVRPLFFDFSNDTNTYSIEQQFLWGKALMVIPVLYPNTTEVTAYLPEAAWYDYYTGKKYDSKGERVNFPAPIDKINLLVKEGSVIPQQEPAQTTTESRNKPFHLLVTADKDGGASGQFYWDDGESEDAVLLDKFNYVFCQLTKGKLTTNTPTKGYSGPMKLNSVTVYGVESNVNTVTANGDTVPHTLDNQVLRIDLTQKNVTFHEPNDISWN